MKSYKNAVTFILCKIHHMYDKLGNKEFGNPIPQLFCLLRRMFRGRIFGDESYLEKRWGRFEELQQCSDVDAL